MSELWIAGDRWRPASASRRTVSAVGAWKWEVDTLRPRSDAIVTWSRSVGMGRCEQSQPWLTNSRGHEATELPIRRARSGSNPAIGGHFERFSSSAPTAMPVPAVSSRASGEQHSTRQPTSRCKSARLSLCVNSPSEEQHSTRLVRFGATDIAHQCSEEEPPAETENHHH